MSIYVIGDIQGCYDELQLLLESFDFNPNQDWLWFTGDLVNRGPKSLAVLRFVSQLPQVISVLGNHDLALLALAYTNTPIKHHTLHEILTASDREQLLSWLRHCPLIYVDDKLEYLLVHAGIPPQWSINEATQYAGEVEKCLKGQHFMELLSHMYGNEPAFWDEGLVGWERQRFIINALTRLRFCDHEGRLNLSFKGGVNEAPPSLIPWYKFPSKGNSPHKILFGHWAALEGKAESSRAIPLDTGCVWGQKLTALRLEDGKRFAIACKKS